MARCECTNPCTCYFEYDGDRPNENYTMPYEYGRYSTRKQGSGTAADPYIIDFLDSEEFMVEAGQIQTVQDNTLPSLTTANQVAGFTQIAYETPNEMFMGVAIHGMNGMLYPSAHKFWLISAQATFIYNGSANGTRRIHIQWQPPANNYGPYGSVILAGTSTTGAAEDMTVSCSGLAPFINFTERVDHYGPGGNFIVGIQQSSGSNMFVRNIKFSLVAI